MVECAAGAAYEQLVSGFGNAIEPGITGGSGLVCPLPGGPAIGGFIDHIWCATEHNVLLIKVIDVLPDGVWTDALRLPVTSTIGSVIDSAFSHHVAGVGVYKVHTKKYAHVKVVHVYPALAVVCGFWILPVAVVR